MGEIAAAEIHYKVEDHRRGGLRFTGAEWARAASVRWQRPTTGVPVGHDRS